MYGSGIPTSAKKVSNREIRRRAEAAISMGASATMMLLACLAQRGGEIVVTQGTIDQCGRNLENLDYVVVDGPTKGEFIVRLLEGKGEGNEPVGEHTGDDRFLGADGGVAEDGSGDDGSAVAGVEETVVSVE